MTSFALSLGCALLAFSPSLSLLLLFAYSKAQLVIIVVTSSFFQLLSCLLAALLHLPFKSLSLGVQDIFIIIPTSILSQAFARCAFVHCYHKVEAVITKSIQRHEQQAGLQQQGQSHGQSQSQGHGQDNHDQSDQEHEPTESEQLQLELNDASSGIAAGVGFAFFHTIMLFGTLLASENSRIGTLYQDSCTIMPSIFNSAIMAFFFGILDIIWVLMTFYGMRRIQLHKSHEQLQSHLQSRNVNGNDNGNGNAHFNANVQRDGTIKIEGKAVLVLVVVTHFAAAFATVPNQTMALNGCVVALPSLALVTLVTIALFVIFCKKDYLPKVVQQSLLHRIRQDGHSD